MHAPEQAEAHELLVNRARVPRIQGATVRRTRHLPQGDVEEIDGIPTLAIPRLLVELAPHVTEVALTAVVDDLLGAGLPGLREEVHARAAALCNGRRRVRRLIELTGPDAAAAFRSWLERHTGGLFSAANLPPADWNIELWDDADDLIGIGDAVWIERCVVVELDGLRFHSTADQRRRDNRKDRRLGTLGWLVLRYTWLDVMERPDEVVAEVRAALVSRQPAGGKVAEFGHRPGG